MYRCLYEYEKMQAGDLVIQDSSPIVNATGWESLNFTIHQSSPWVGQKVETLNGWNTYDVSTRPAVYCVLRKQEEAA